MISANYEKWEIHEIVAKKILTIMNLEFKYIKVFITYIVSI
jgi:hypothetical protein